MRLGSRACPSHRVEHAVEALLLAGWLPPAPGPGPRPSSDLAGPPRAGLAGSVPRAASPLSPRRGVPTGGRDESRPHVRDLFLLMSLCCYHLHRKTCHRGGQATTLALPVLLIRN